MLSSGSLLSQRYVPVQFVIQFVRPFIPSADCWQETATYMTVPCPGIDLFSQHKNLVTLFEVLLLFIELEVLLVTLVRT